jgi:hypothetical protein
MEALPIPAAALTNDFGSVFGSAKICDVGLLAIRPDDHKHVVPAVFLDDDG